MKDSSFADRSQQIEGFREYEPVTISDNFCFGKGKNLETTRVVMKLTPLGKSPVRSLSVTFGQAPPNASDPDHDKLRTRFWQKFPECPKPVVSASNPPSPVDSDLDEYLMPFRLNNSAYAYLVAGASCPARRKMR